MTIESDPLCINCGYNLRGLRTTGTCPECGTAIEYTLRGNLLRNAHPDWLRKLQSGIALVLASYAWVVLLIAAIVAGLLDSLNQWLTLSLFYVYQAGLLAAAWRVSTPELPETHIRVRWSWRTILRISTVISVAAFMRYGVDPYAPLAQREAGVVLLAVASAIGILSGAIATYAFFAYVGVLAKRVPDQELWGIAQGAKWGLTVFWVLLTVVIDAVNVYTATAPTLRERGYYISTLESYGCIMMGVGPVAACLAIVVLVRLRAALRAARRAQPD